MSSRIEVRIDEIAARVGAIVAGRYGERLSDAADGLGIPEYRLRAVIHGRGSTLSHDVLIDVLTRLVRHFGVDPAWLVTGRYDVRSHAAAEENRADKIGLRYQLRRLLSGPDRTVDIEPVREADIRTADGKDLRPGEWVDGPAPPTDSLDDTANRRPGRGDEPER